MRGRPLGGRKGRPRQSGLDGLPAQQERAHANAELQRSRTGRCEVEKVLCELLWLFGAGSLPEPGANDPS